MSKRLQVGQNLLTFLPYAEIVLLSTYAMLAFFGHRSDSGVFYYYVFDMIAKISFMDIFAPCLCIACSAAIIVLYCLVGRQTEPVQSWQAVRPRNWNKIRLICGIVMVVISIFAFFMSVSGPMLDEPKCFEFSDGEHTIVIEEEAFMFGGWGTVYQVEESGKAVVLKGFTTDDGYRNEGNYDIRWSDDSAEITFNDGQGGKTTVTVEFK